MANNTQATRIAVVVFHPDGRTTVKGFLRDSSLPDTFGLAEARPCHLSLLAARSKAIKELEWKTFGQGPGVLSEVHGLNNPMPAQAGNPGQVKSEEPMKP